MLDRLTKDLAAAVMAVDALRPVAKNKRTGVAFEAGLGPHSEAETLRLIFDEVRRANSDWYLDVEMSVPYPSKSRQKCDVRIRTPSSLLFIEGKLLRLKGDNGLPNDNMLMHILSPYAYHRSALTDCAKLAVSNFEGEKAILIIGYSYPDIPLEPAVDAFETLAKRVAKISRRFETSFSRLCHRVHGEGKVMAWAVQELNH